MNKYKIKQITPLITVTGNFDESCELIISQESLNALENGTLKVKINGVGHKPIITRLTITICSVAGNIVILAGGDDSSIELSEGSLGNYDLRVWEKSKIIIGKKTTSNSVKIICNNSEFICGEDCMFSDGILIQTTDQHAIVDIQSGLIINDQYKSVSLGDHVWLGRDCTLTSNAQIGEGTVIGTCSIVTGTIPEKVIAVGTPAKVIKENHTWSRSPNSLDLFSKKYIEGSS